MSTRCTISVKGGYDTFYIYRHSDGYPEGIHGVPATLAKVLPYAWPLPRFEGDDFAAAIVAAWKAGGGNIRFSSGHDAHSDTEYQYFITHNNGLQLKIRDVYADKTIFDGSLEEAIEKFKED